MTAQFWIETVEHTIEVPVFKPGSPPLALSPKPTRPGQIVPVATLVPKGPQTVPPSAWN